jgi:two-component system, OmpR family, sensor kinase
VKVPSLQRRLRLVIAIAMVVLVTVTAVVTTEVLQSRLDSDLEARLATRVALASTLRSDTDSAALASRLSDRDIRVVIGNAEPVGDGDGYHGPGRFTVSKLADGTTVTFIISDSIDKMVQMLLVVEAAVGLASLALLLLALSWLTRRLLAPVDEVVAAAEQIAGGARGTRLLPDRSDTELGRLATSFDKMMDSVEGSEARLRQFVSDASHELRTPTAAIQAAAEGLVDDDTPGPERDQRLFDLVASTHRLSRLVNDLLDLDRLQESPAAMVGSPVDVSKLIDEVVARTPTRTTVSLQRTGAASAPTVGHPDRLSRLLSNVIDNAQRHAPDNSSVGIDVQTGHREIVVTVTNDGAAVPAIDRERIFDRFTRLDSARTSTRGGNGLGLAISRAIAEEHDGTLMCEEPRDGRGAAFVLRLPRPA